MVSEIFWGCMQLFVFCFIGFTGEWLMKKHECKKSIGLLNEKREIMSKIRARIRAQRKGNGNANT